MAPSGFRRTGLEWFSSLPACLLLLAVVLFSTSSDIHNQMLRGGEQLWSGYYKLRMDPAKPECDANRDIEAAVAEEMAREAPADDPMAALQGLIAGVGRAAIRYRTLNRQAHIGRVFFHSAQQGGHGIIRRGFPGHFLGHRNLDIPAGITLRLGRIHPELVVAAPELLPAPEHLVVNITAGGEQHHCQQQQASRQGGKPFQPGTTKTTRGHNYLLRELGATTDHPDPWFQSAPAGHPRSCRTAPSGYGGRYFLPRAGQT